LIRGLRIVRNTPAAQQLSVCCIDHMNPRPKADMLVIISLPVLDQRSYMRLSTGKSFARKALARRRKPASGSLLSSTR
jgi:hypothetical protein